MPRTALLALCLLGLAACQTRDLRQSETARRLMPFEGQPVFALIKYLGRPPNSVLPAADGSKLYTFASDPVTTFAPGTAFTPATALTSSACTILIETNARDIITSATLSGRCS